MNVADQSRIDRALESLPRSDFIASDDLGHLVAGRGIPSRAAARVILERLASIGFGRHVLVVGSGSGYLAGLLSRIVAEVVVVERHDEVADIARANLARAGLDNITIVLDEGERGVPDRSPYDLVFCTPELSDTRDLQSQLIDGGHLVCLEGPDPLVPHLVDYERRGDRFPRRELGVVNLRLDSGEMLIDLGFVQEAALEEARAEARRSREPVIAALRKRIEMPEEELYRTLARRFDLKLMSADELLKRVDPDLFPRFSTTFLDNQRIVPIAVEDGTLYVASDNPDVATELLRVMRDYRDVVVRLVTPTDFRRLWSLIDLSRQGHDRLKWTSLPEEKPAGEDLLDNSNRELSHYLVSLYESVLLDAVTARASDIHLERYGDRIRIRIRVDGELHDLTHYQLTPRDHAGLINVIKVRAEINIAER
ncbi:MAG: protein-L-isoaspartate(D-aspartate) O-methyltransferase, partial [Gammaproteobacteria bacterium]|nr:protein-L-isoaspartate(D-aspartate) O-methyltransferase [Gammaproteobacteria bacterium]